MGSRRGFGEGSITQRKDGLWVARVSIGGGKRKSYYGRTRKEVAEKLKVALREQQQGTLPAAPGLTVQEYLESWLRDVSASEVRPRSLRNYQDYVRLHVGPSIGGTKLEKLGPRDLQRLYNELGTKLAPKTVGNVHAFLHVAFETAVRWGYLGRNPCDLVDPPRVPAPETRALSFGEIQAFLRAARAEDEEALYVLALATGMRQGELLGLKWADLDFQAELLHVRRSLAQVPGRGPVEQEPKTKASRRSLHLIPAAQEALKRQRVRVAELRLRAGPEWGEHDYVFPSARGGALNQSNLLHRSFYPLLVRAGLPRIRFHDLRHSVATYLFAMKKHPKAVQEALGHSEIRTTLDIYTHPASEAQVDALSALQRLFT